MFGWLRSLLPHLPHYGYALVFIVVFLNNLGFPLPGETILLGAGFVLGKNGLSLLQPMAAGSLACFLGGICAFGIGRHVGRSDLEKFRWLRLAPEVLKWVDQFLDRHGGKTIFITRFIALFPPVIANLLAGTSKMSWPTFLFFNLTGSVAYTTAYILIGYLFGKKWKLLVATLGSTVLYLLVAGIALIAVGVIFRKPLSIFWKRLWSRKHKGEY